MASAGSKRPRADGSEEEEDVEELPLLPTRRPGGRVVKGRECPYLDTIDRRALDFDFEKACSVTMSTLNVYVCLVCGRYFAGRAPGTPAHTHAIESGHYVFMSLRADRSLGRVFVLPDDYEVEDRSLDDIRIALDPKYTPEEVGTLDDGRWAHSLDGGDFMPGLVGLNDLGNASAGKGSTDYVNVVVQSLLALTPLRDFFLAPENYAACSSPLVSRFGELTRKIWSDRAFKGQVSPHEFMQAVMAASGKRFRNDEQGDPIDFLSWLLNQMHLDLTGGKRKKASVITDCFRGELEVTIEKGTLPGGGPEEDKVDRVPFFMLGLDLPPAPLFADGSERNIIPQVQLFTILSKYDGVTPTELLRAGRRRHRITKLPSHLICHVKRFRKNNFFVEKNPTIVNFPVKGLVLGDYVPLPEEPLKPAKRCGGGVVQPADVKYDLVANVVHDGKPGTGTYRAHIRRRGDNTWYDVQDLHVTEILPQVVSLSETYLQVYELRRDGEGPGAAGGPSEKRPAAGAGGDMFMD